MTWPNKEEREAHEIRGFTEAYARLPEARHLAVVSKSEKPDWRVVDELTGERFGVELTSVYLHDRSVPDEHMNWGEGENVHKHIPYCAETLGRYRARIISAINDKIQKARVGYDTTRPLILGIYINEYIGIYLGEEELESLVRENEGFFDSMAPFSEVVFWSLGNGGIFRVRPS